MADKLRDKYEMDKYGNFESREEAERACRNGDVRRLNNNRFWDPDENEEYWDDGEKI